MILPQPRAGPGNDEAPPSPLCRAGGWGEPHEAEVCQSCFCAAPTAESPEVAKDMAGTVAVHRRALAPQALPVGLPSRGR